VVGRLLEPVCFLYLVRRLCDTDDMLAGAAGAETGTAAAAGAATTGSAKATKAGAAGGATKAAGAGKKADKGAA
jgi:hypothetical protein